MDLLQASLLAYVSRINCFLIIFISVFFIFTWFCFLRRLSHVLLEVTSKSPVIVLCTAD